MKKNEKIVFTQGENKFAFRFYSEDNQKPVIFCFPHVGGNSNSFRALAQVLCDKVNIVAIDPPGHGVVNGQLMQNIYELAEIYYEGILPFIHGEFYILGHSLGGLIGYLLAAKLEENGQAPKGVIISASAPPNRIEEEMDSMQKFDTSNGIKTELEEFGGKYAQLAKSNSIFLFSAIRVIKADYKLIRSFQEKNSTRLNCRGFILFSQEDKVAKAEYMADWKNYCPGCELIKVNGEHSYIMENAREVGEILANRILK